MSFLFPFQFKSLLRGASGLLRPWRSLGSHQKVSFDDDKFEANLDVRHYKPDEITVEVAENTVIVEGQHEEKDNDHRFLARQFVEKYVLPKGYYDVTQVQSQLSSDGVLTITAPKVNRGDAMYTKVVPVVKTGRPFKG
jgi:crystallin alpha B